MGKNVATLVVSELLEWFLQINSAGLSAELLKHAIKNAYVPDLSAVGFHATERDPRFLLYQGGSRPPSQPPRYRGP